jgi:putative restriction endonuclease
MVVSVAWRVAEPGVHWEAAGMGVDGIEFRNEIFRLLDDKLRDTPGYLTRAELESFRVQGLPMPLVDNYQAIHNPSEPIELDATLSVYTVPGSRYADGDSSDGVWRYGYTGKTPGGRNKKLRKAFELQLPIIFYDWIAPGLFAPLYPVYVVEDHPEDLYVLLEDGGVRGVGSSDGDTAFESAFRRTLVNARMHQREFRARVVHAYEGVCAICELPHGALLDAAHIRPYGEAIDGRSAAKDVTNGLSLCVIHHRAYDRRLLGIDGERRLYVSPEVQAIQDGPVLASSLQHLEGTRMTHVPKGKLAPDPDRLERTFKEFLEAIAR